MTRCNRGVVLGNVTRWCNRAAGHKGDHLTVWQLRDFPFPEPPPRYTAQGLVVEGAEVRSDANRAAKGSDRRTEPLRGNSGREDDAA